MQLFFLALESSFYNKTKYVYKRYFKDNNFFVDDLRNTLYNVAVQIDNAIICLKTSELKKKFSLRNWLKRFDVAKVHNYHHVHVTDVSQSESINLKQS